MKTLLLALSLAIIALSVPSNFDLRLQMDLVRYTSYDLQSQGICAGYAWAKEIAQIVSNAVGLYQQSKISLSAQHILDCTETETDLCYQATLQNIHDAIKRLTLEGLTTTDCYPNKPFSYPNGFCKRQCHDGTSFIYNYYPKFTKLSKFSEVIDLFKKNQQIAVMAILKVDDAFNYYSPFGGSLIAGGPSSVYEYRVAEVVGWKDYLSSLKVILRAGAGEHWGYNGFIDLQLSKYQKYIEQLYVVQLSDQANLRPQ